MKIGILGGSFDPIHEGHLALARQSQKQFRLDKILFIPAFYPPHKSKGKAIPVASGEDRAQMVKLSIEGERDWEFCDIELKRLGISYTVDTLRELRKIYPPPHELFFIAGADSFQDFPHWKNPDEILRLSEWIVAPRPSVRLPEKMPPRFHLLKMAPLAVSASEVRQKIDRGEDLSNWIPSQARDYLEQKKIYQRARHG